MYIERLFMCEFFLCKQVTVVHQRGRSLNYAVAMERSAIVEIQRIS
jgi:hypothetical protein